MPDLYTPRPDIVKRVLEDAGLEARVTPTILTDRPAEITYRFRGNDYYAELYVHDLTNLPGRAAFPEPLSLGVGIALGAVAMAGMLWRRLRAQRR